MVSFAPLAADYSRHATSGRSAFASSATGYGLAIFAYYALGVFAVAHLGGDLAGTNLLAALMVLPVGGLAIGLLLLDELDNAFANVYSSTVSVHNLAPRWIDASSRWRSAWWPPCWPGWPGSTSTRDSST